MKKFIYKYVIFIFPLIVLLICDIFSPIDAFTYRPWEALLFRSNTTMFFYPNEKLDNESVGDLCHHTKFAVKKKEYWITDSLGYRNNMFIYNADVLIIGDSFTLGSSITQDSTLTNLLSNKLNKSVYNMAPADFMNFIDLLNQGVIKKPKVLIYSFIERNLPTSLKKSKEKRDSVGIVLTSAFRDKIERLYSLKYLKSRVSGKHGKGVPGIKDSKMFFLKGAKQTYHYNSLVEAATIIQSFKEYCDAIGVEFICLPLPNKETVYFEKVPFKTQPNYLFKLDSILKENKIKTINTLELYNKYRLSNSSLIYHLDDSHWNARGVELVTKKLAEYISVNTQQVK